MTSRNVSIVKSALARGRYSVAAFIRGPKGRRYIYVRLAIFVNAVFYACVALYVGLSFVLDFFGPILQPLAERPRLAGAVIALAAAGIGMVFLCSRRLRRALSAFRLERIASYLSGSEEDSTAPQESRRSRRHRARW